MTGFPSLQELVQRELGRRQDEGANYNPFRFVVKNSLKSLTNVGEVVAAVEAELEARDKSLACSSPVIAPGIKDDVIAALHAKYPRRFTRPGVGIIVRTIVDSTMRHAEVPEVGIDGGPSSPIARLDDDKAAAERARQQAEADAAEEAARRISAMRGQF
jgi:hypothetical protein